MWTTTNTKPLCFKSIPEGYEKKECTEKACKVPQEAVEFLTNRFIKTN